jgi:hypothetical protein
MVIMLTTVVVAGATVMVSDLVAVCAVGVVASITLTVKLNTPEAVGVPEIVPLPALKLTPVGSDPALIDHVYGVVPPLAERVVEYLFSVCAEGSPPVVTERDDGAAALLEPPRKATLAHPAYIKPTSTATVAQ